MKFKKFIFLSLYLLIILIISGVISPLQIKAVSPNSILVNVVPENPAPNENVNITLNSYASNLDSVLIVWFVDAKSIVSGIGKKSFSVNAPAFGGETTVTVTISLPDGEIEKVITIRPASMFLLWQANDSYVPPFYKGKALPTPDSEIKIIAMPEVKAGASVVDSKNMIYTWKQDYTNMPESSGYGKNSFIYINDYLENSNTVSVIASTVDQKYSASASIDVGTSEVKILFYQNDTNLGTIWEHSLYDGYKIEGDAILEAAPYFISPKDLRIPVLSWVWSINNNKIDVSGSRKNIIPLKVQEGTSGTSKVRLDIENKYRIFGTADGEINVTF